MRAPVWELDGRDWPNRDHSAFLSAGGSHWHVQRMGQGPRLLLVHGTGAATHSWRGLAPLLARHFEILAPDLPGHGFTRTLDDRRLSLPNMAASLSDLVRALDFAPDLALGHSAGAAVLARMCLDGGIAPRALISLNGALLPLSGLPGHWFAPAARLLAANPLAARFFAWQAGSEQAVRRLLDSTGSRIDPRGVELYRRLVATPAHVASALKMMANWDLGPMVRDLPRLKTPLVLLVAEGDATVRPIECERVQALVPRVRTVRIPKLGHLAHEERPEAIAERVLDIASDFSLW